jgi:hypothetical protein
MGKKTMKTLTALFAILILGAFLLNPDFVFLDAEASMEQVTQGTSAKHQSSGTTSWKMGGSREVMSTRIQLAAGCTKNGNDCAESSECCSNNCVRVRDDWEPGGELQLCKP